MDRWFILASVSLIRFILLYYNSHNADRCIVADAFETEYESICNYSSFEYYVAYSIVIVCYVSNVITIAVFDTEITHGMGGDIKKVIHLYGFKSLIVVAIEKYTYGIKGLFFIPVHIYPRCNVVPIG